jgi:transposase
VPRQNSTGGKHRLGGISKRGNQYLREALIKAGGKPKADNTYGLELTTVRAC